MKLVKALTILFLLGVYQIASAQTATVTATVVDAQGCPYSNATYNFNLIDQNGNDITPGYIVYQGGIPFTVPNIQGTMDGFGKMTQVGVLLNNVLTSPQNTQWNISVCSQNPAFFPGNNIPRMQCFHGGPWTITGNRDLSSELSALAPPLGCNGGGGSGSFRTQNLDPIFNSTPTTPTTGAVAQTFTLQNADPFDVLGNFAGVPSPWAKWQLVAGNNITITPNGTAKTVTFASSSPLTLTSTNPIKLNSTNGPYTSGTVDVECPSCGSASLTNLINNPPTGQYTTLYFDNAVITNMPSGSTGTISGNGSTPGTLDAGWGCVGLLCVVSDTFRATFSGVTIPSYVGTITNVWVDMYSSAGTGSYTQLPLTAMTCNTHSQLPASVPWGMQETTVLSGWNSGSLPTASCSITLGANPSGVTNAGVLFKIAALRLLVQYTGGSAPPVDNSLHVNYPLYYFQPDNSLNLDLTNLPSGHTLSTYIVNLPTASSSSGLAYFIVDGTTATDCSVGTNSVVTGNAHWCLSDGSTWKAWGGGGGTTNNPLTANSSGGAAPGTQFNGSSAVTYDYHSFGAPGISGTPTTGNCANWASASTLGDSGSPCGSGGGGLTGQVANYLPKANSATTSNGPSIIEDQGTGVVIHGTATSHGITVPEATPISGSAGNDVLTADSTTHRWLQNPNNVGATVIPGTSTTAATSGNCVKYAANGYDIVDAGAACGSGSGGVSSLNSLTGALNITAGTGITVTPSGSNIQVSGSPFGFPTGTQIGYFGSSWFLLNGQNFGASPGVKSYTAASCTSSSCVLSTTNTTGFTAGHDIVVQPTSSTSPSCLDRRAFNITSISAGTSITVDASWNSCGTVSGGGGVFWSADTSVPEYSCANEPWFQTGGTCHNYAIGGNTWSVMDANFTTQMQPQINAMITAAAGKPVIAILYNTDTNGQTTDEGHMLSIAAKAHALGSNVLVYIHSIEALCISPEGIGSYGNGGDWSLESSWMPGHTSASTAPSTGQYFDKFINLHGVMTTAMCGNYGSDAHLSDPGTKAIADKDNAEVGLAGTGATQNSLATNAANYVTGDINVLDPSNTNNYMVWHYEGGLWTLRRQDPNQIGNGSYVFEQWGIYNTFFPSPSLGKFGCWAINSTEAQGIAADTFLGRNGAAGEFTVGTNCQTKDGGIALTYLDMQATTAPTGACTVTGRWEWAKDGTSAWCNGSTWQANGSTAFSGISSGTNTTAAMVVGSGASLAPTGTGTIQATNISGTVAATSPITVTGSGTTASPYTLACPTCGTSTASAVSINGGSALGTFHVNGQTAQVCADTSGSGTSQTCTTTDSFTPAANNCWTYTTTTANTSTALTLSINSLSKSVAIPGTSGFTTTLTASAIPANKPMTMCYDGTNYNIQSTGSVASGGSGAWTNITASVTPTGCAVSSGACVVSGTTTTAVTFASIPAHNRMQITVWGANSANGSLKLTVNGDTGANYAQMGYFSNTSVVVNSGASVTGCNFAFNTLINQEIYDFLFYADTSFAKSFHGVNAASDSISSLTNDFDVSASCVWNNTAAITSTTFTGSTGHIMAGTKFMILAQD